MHREVGLIILLIGGFMLFVTIGSWIANKVAEARERTEIQEWNETLAKMKAVSESDDNVYGWTSDKDSNFPYYAEEMQPYGTEYDPEADTRAFIAKMQAETDAAIAMFKIQHHPEREASFEETRPLRASR